MDSVEFGEQIWYLDEIERNEETIVWINFRH